MTGNDIKEIKKQFSLDNCTIDHICGCYVNNEKEKQVPLREPDLLMVITGGEMAYTRKDGVKIVPIGTLRD